jgi:hypothetical protein
LALLSRPSILLSSPFISSHLSPFLSDFSSLSFIRPSSFSSDRLFKGDFPILLLMLLLLLGGINFAVELLLGEPGG